MIRLAKPDFGPEELAAVQAALSVAGEEDASTLQAFESRVGDMVGAPFACAVSSATAGIELALAALDIGPGDEVIVPAFTFPACVNAVFTRGATPVFVDIEFPSLNIDIERALDAISPRTRAIIPVHAFGWPIRSVELSRLLGIDRVHVLEDAACALGARDKEYWAGAMATAGIYSFHLRKIATTGEGGLVVVSSPDLYERMTRLRSHGVTQGPLYAEFVEPGHNFRMSSVAAALGLVQVSRLSELVARRQYVAEEYSRRLCDVPDLDLGPATSFPGRVFQSYVVCVSGAISRDDVIRRLRELGVESTLGTYGLPWQPAYRGVEIRGGADVARRAFEQTLALPIHSRISEEDIDHVCASVRESLRS